MINCMLHYVTDNPTDIVIDHNNDGIGDEVRIRIENGICYVIFKGSDDPLDWILNANIHVNAYGLHSGFHAEIRKMKNTIVRELVKLRPNRIHLIGHSRGGALAYIFAKLYAPELIWRPVINLVTFGQPKCDTQPTAINNYTRIVNGNDPVPDLPLTRYKHAGHKIILGDRQTAWLRLGKIAIGLASRRWPNMADALRLAQLDINDHDMSAYIAAAEREQLALEGQGAY